MGCQNIFKTIFDRKYRKCENEQNFGPNNQSRNIENFKMSKSIRFLSFISKYFAIIFPFIPLSSPLYLKQMQRTQQFFAYVSITTPAIHEDSSPFCTRFDVSLQNIHRRTKEVVPLPVTLQKYRKNKKKRRKGRKISLSSRNFLHRSTTILK